MAVITIVIITIITSALGAAAAYLIVTKTIEKRKDTLLKDAEAEGEMIKKEKILQAKERFIQLKAEHEKQVNERNSRIVQTENRLKENERAITQKLDELEKRGNDLSAQKGLMENKLQVMDARKEDLEKKFKEQLVLLEQISGMSSDEAKNILMESMKTEARSEAMAYISEAIEEAKMTANKEAKRIVVQSIQRVATETAIENSVTVFNIEGDEVKGRIIGREGRNIRALEAVTGVEIIVDDTP
ncbi:MAG: Rnase Y domain-containing protein, partial [Rikenellaceae bacterium]|nr:Rnase Y domain-containing protein [Rikenellaceae bacterium]